MFSHLKALNCRLPAQLSVASRRARAAQFRRKSLLCFLAFQHHGEHSGMFFTGK